MLLGLATVGGQAHQRIHAPHAAADRGLAHQLDGADRAGAVDVGAAAQLTGPVPAMGDHTDDVAVLLAEQRLRAESCGLVELTSADR